MQLLQELIVTRFKLADIRTQARTDRIRWKKSRGSNKNDENADPNGASPAGSEGIEHVHAAAHSNASGNNNLPTNDNEDKDDEAGEEDQFSKEKLFAAAESGDMMTINSILDPKSQVSQEYGVILGVALGRSCINGNTHIVRKLLTMGAKIDSLLAQEQMPLHVAANHGQYGLSDFRFLFLNKSNVTNFVSRKIVLSCFSVIIT